MSLLRVSIIDKTEKISGIVHYGVAERLIASLSMDPETIVELDAVLTRFQKDNISVSFREEMDEEEMDEELTINLKTGSVKSRQWVFDLKYIGEVEYHDGHALCVGNTIPYQIDVAKWHLWQIFSAKREKMFSAKREKNVQ